MSECGRYDERLDAWNGVRCFGDSLGGINGEGVIYARRVAFLFWIFRQSHL